MSIAPVPDDVGFPHSRSGAHAVRARAHRHALDAALRKAAILERLDPRGDPYGAAGQALEDFVKREEQILGGGEDVRGWISTVTERRWINELRYQGRRTYDRLDGPVSAGTTGTLGDVVAAPGLGIEDVVELREHVHSVVGEQRAALAFLRQRGVQARHVRIVELALTSDLMHHEIAGVVNRESPGRAEIAGNTVTQVIRRLRERLAGDDAWPTVVARLRRTRAAA
jgi:hypothetical protein